MPKRLRDALLASIWFMILTLPVMGIRVNSADGGVEWMPWRVLWLGAGILLLSPLWSWCFERRERGLPILVLPEALRALPGTVSARLRESAGTRRAALGGLLALLIAMPLATSLYQTNIMISALLYVMLALGLNIAVGLAGQLVLGQAAFYAIGAYSYALLNQAFGLGFWICLPLGGLAAMLFGLGLGLPVLRLRGDYLAIVTLGFGEIVRLTLLNWADVTGGSAGMKNIPPPSVPGMELDITGSTILIYYVSLAAAAASVVLVSRLKNSRVGLALCAMREDEIACEAMGVHLARIKLTAFALSAAWAGLAGVIFASRTSFINPFSFTFMESAMILSMVVLGGMGSISGVIIAALFLVLAPEYLRAFSEYRMLIFGAVMAVMMIFRPQGLVTDERRRYRITKLHGAEGGRP